MTTEVVAKAQSFVDTFNEKYAKKHEAFEIQFWGTKMALSDTKDIVYNSENLSKTKAEMENMLCDAKVLEEAKNHLASIPTDNKEEQIARLRKTLEIIVKTCNCYYMPPEAKEMREETNAMESKLEMARNSMKLGYRTTTTTKEESKEEEEFVELSSVGLRNLLRTSKEESIRKAAYEGLRSIGPFVCSHGFVEIVKLRNKLAKSLGYEDYYDYTVQQSEGFSKQRLFEILDGLEVETRPLMLKAREELAKRHGESALEPYNMSYAMAGSVIKKMDPYFPFSKAVENYARSYAAMNIDYQGATMTLDLLDRSKKYSNGFCHWPKCSWVKPNGEHVPSQTNFTSLAQPEAVGSGHTALTTLMHEAGHAAHFANVKQPSPLFSQERAPTSVAYAENQSMFLDSLVDDAAWQAKYAQTVEGQSIPFSIMEEKIQATAPFRVFALRAMLAVSYYEKALYELPDDQVTKEKMLQLADDIELQIQGGKSPRPLLSVPHLISDEASCYYQGYTLAEMSVHQTRQWFLNKYGYIVDNPNVGPILTKAYWEHGNSKPFLEIVKDLTGKELSGEDWTNTLKETVDDEIARKKQEYEKAIQQVLQEKEQEKTKDNTTTIDLNMTVRFIDGDLVIADSSQESNGFIGACHKFEQFVSNRMEQSKKKEKEEESKE